MKIFESKLPNFFTDILRSNLFKIKMNISFLFIVFVSIASIAEEISMNINQKIVESEFVDQIISTETISLTQITFISISITSISVTLILVQNILILTETIFISNSFTSINSKKIKFMFLKKKQSKNENRTKLMKFCCLFLSLVSKKSNKSCIGPKSHYFQCMHSMKTRIS